MGPWWCQFLVNTSDIPKKQTHLCSHTYPHHYESVMNKILATSSEKKGASENGWVTMQIVGPFNKWVDALRFQILWSDHTRGKIRRVERGVDLLSAYYQEHNLYMEAQHMYRSDILKHKQRKKHKERTFVIGNNNDDNSNSGFGNNSKRKRSRTADIPLQELERSVYGKGNSYTKFTIDMIDRLQSKRKIKHK